MIEKSIASPSASNAYVEPSESPLMHCWTNSWKVIRSRRHAEVGRLHAAIAAEFLRRPLGVDPAHAHQVRAVADPKRLVDVLLDEQDGDALLAPEAHDQVKDEPDELGREAERGLVEEQEPRPRHESPCDRELLLLPARERGRRQPQPLAERREELEQPFPPGVVARPARGGAEAQVLRHRQAREDPPALGREADAAADHALRRQVADLAPVELDRPGARPVQADDRHERGRLAGAVRAQERHDLALADAQVYVPHGHDRPVARGEPAHLQEPSGPFAGPEVVLRPRLDCYGAGTFVGTLFNTLTNLPPLIWSTTTMFLGLCWPWPRYFTGPSAPFTVIPAESAAWIFFGSVLPAFSTAASSTLMVS